MKKMKKKEVAHKVTQACFYQVPQTGDTFLIENVFQEDKFFVIRDMCSGEEYQVGFGEVDNDAIFLDLIEAI